jgi:hypothetical protein
MCSADDSLRPLSTLFQFSCHIESVEFRSDASLNKYLARVSSTSLSKLSVSRCNAPTISEIAKSQLTPDLVI